MAEKKKKDYPAIEKDEASFQKFKKNFVKQALRKSTYRWPFKHLERSSKRIERGFYKCDSCAGAFGPKDIQSDHKIPVEDIKTGFTTWDNYIDRLFVKSDGFQTLCLMCHKSKTDIENELRRQNGQKPVRHKIKKK